MCRNIIQFECRILRLSTKSQSNTTSINHSTKKLCQNICIYFDLVLLISLRAGSRKAWAHCRILNNRISEPEDGCDKSEGQRDTLGSLDWVDVIWLISITRLYNTMGPLSLQYYWYTQTHRPSIGTKIFQDYTILPLPSRCLHFNKRS